MMSLVCNTSEPVDIITNPTVVSKILASGQFLVEDLEILPETVNTEDCTFPDATHTYQIVTAAIQTPQTVPAAAQTPQPATQTPRTVFAAAQTPQPATQTPQTVFVDLQTPQTVGYTAQATCQSSSFVTLTLRCANWK